MSRTLDASETTVDVNGVRLFTRRAGAGPPVVVLHGGPGASHDYLLPQYDALARHRALLYYDQRGGGRSPAPRDTPLGWREHVADLEALRQHWNIERLVLVGYSWGGLLAVLYSLEHPDRIERLALIAPAGLSAASQREFEHRLGARMTDPRITRTRADLQASGLATSDPEKYRRLAFALSVAVYFRDPNMALQMTPFRITARTQQAVWHSLGDYDLRTRIREVLPKDRAPRTLIVHGIYDPLPLAGSRDLAALLGAGIVSLPTGHAPHVEAPREFAATLDSFLPHR